MMQQVTRNIIVPIEEYGIMVEDEMGHLLLDSLPGLYTPAYKGVVGLGSNNNRVVNSDMGISPDDGRIVLVMPNLNNAHRHERSKGTVGTCLVKDFVNSLIDNSLNWVERKIRFSQILDAYLVNPENSENSQLCEERIRAILQGLTTDVYNFIGQDVWCIYKTNQIGLDLKISKLEDFRIHEYMRLKREGVI
jgi:hypothetical protein